MRVECLREGALSGAMCEYPSAVRKDQVSITPSRLPGDDLAGAVTSPAQPEAERLLGALTDALRHRLQPQEVHVIADYATLCRTPVDQLAAPEFRRDAVAAADAVGRHLAAAYGAGRGRRRPGRLCLTLRATPATGSLYCQAALMSRSLPELRSEQCLRDELAPHLCTLVEWAPDGAVTFALYPTTAR